MESYDYPEYYEHPVLHDAAVMNLILKASACGAVTKRDCIQQLCCKINAVDGITCRESREPLQMTFIAEKVRLAKRYLTVAGLVADLAEGTFRLTVRGREMLDRYPTGLDQSILAVCPEFINYIHSLGKPAGSGDMKDRYAAGYRAFGEGLDYTENPHRADSMAFGSWSDGWREAFDETLEHKQSFPSGG
ncbi:hypothetical protein [Aestuariispira insulae]|uniref:Mrr restriction endonuclease-like protein n=1 Tax=Aestuariispira insulae TaxID=1461337 RepID=A0A3D9HXR4_9PROT|nr:hypothetical protein [Aestuariispira insulae]RED54161.1 hypothetical protein DFP90_101964 [Aestuariispira insulae]